METGKTPPPTLKAELPELPLLLRELNRLELRNGVLQSLQNDMGHMGVERTVDLIRARIYWPKMYMAVENMIKTCERCVRRKTLPETAAPLVNIKTCRPLELACMDFLSLEPDRSNTKDILVITDHFTKYAVAIPTTNQRACTVAKCLWDNFIVHYGFPERLHSDQGPYFESKTIKELCELAGIKKVPYHPCGNPVERFNRTLLQMLGTLSQPDKLHWKDFVKPLVHAYNCTKNETTGFSPYKLMFERQPRLPIDLAFGLPTNTNKLSHSQYVSDLKCRLEESYKIATFNAQKNADCNKTQFDKRVVDSTLEEGDRVLVRNVKLRGKPKLANRWEDDVYIVLRKAGDMPVYTVKPEGKNGPVCTLHRDLLLPCGFLSAAMTNEPVTQLPVRRPRTRQCPTIESEEEESSDSEIVPTCIFFPLQTPKLDINETQELINPPCMIRQSNEPNVPSVPVLSDSPAYELPAGDRDELSMQNLPEQVNLSEPVHETDQHESDLPDIECSVENSNLPENVCPVERGNLPDDVNDIQNKKLPVLSDVSESIRKDELDEMETQSEEKTEKQPGMDTSVRRLERARQPPKRLDYAELGKPLVTVVKSFFQGLTTALAEALREEENSPYPSDLPTQINYI